jgi:hypothetical protein
MKGMSDLSMILRAFRALRGSKKQFTGDIKKQFKKIIFKIMILP